MDTLCDDQQSVWIVGMNSPTLVPIAFDDPDDANDYLEGLDVGADAVEIERVPEGSSVQHTAPDGHLSTRESATKSWSELQEEASEQLPDDYGPDVTGHSGDER